MIQKIKSTLIEWGIKVGTFVASIVIVIIMFQIGTAMFGNFFKADKTVLAETTKAQEDLHNALLVAFFDFGRLDVREDYSVIAYIPKRNFMMVAYPDRDKVIGTVGRTWCNDQGYYNWYLPKVVLRDIQIGETLGTYRCITGLFSY